MAVQSNRQKPTGGRISIGALVLLAGLLVLPSTACLQVARSSNRFWVFGYVAVISGITFWVYWRDKRRAVAGEWTTPESVLHLAEVLGGWAAAFLARRTIRHKISKTSYQATFWLIVTLHEVVALDFLRDWQISHAVIKLLQR